MRLLINNFNTTRSFYIIGIVALLGITARLAVTKVGFNPDLASWSLVANFATQGNNIYASTEHYNYGPFWFNFLYFIRSISNSLYEFHYSIAIFLTLIDLIIFFIIKNRMGLIAASLFFLNPISIIITGYHCQFDNLAIMVGMLSILCLKDNFEVGMNNKKIGGLILLGVSISIKHILFLFPLWLAVKQKGKLNKLLTLLIPTTVFLALFIPYWANGAAGIINNVFLYRSFPLDIFYNLFIPKFIQFYLSGFWFWIFILTICAFLFRKYSAFDSLLIYLTILVATAPSTANQYLAIVIPYISTSMNIFFILYTLIGTWHLLVDTYGLHWNYENYANQPMYYNILISLLFFGLIMNFLSEKIKNLIRALVKELKYQFME